MEKYIARVLTCVFFLILVCSPLKALEIDTYHSWKNTTPGWTSKIKLADIDNDGYVDLITANYLRTSKVSNKADIRIYRNIGGVFEKVASQVIRMKKDVGSWNIALGDYDNDGYLDIASSNVAYEKDLIFKNNRGKFAKDAVWQSCDTSVSHGLDWVDYDRDGDLDLSVSAAYSGAKVYDNMGGSVAECATWESYEALDFQDVDWVDMDNDGDFDLATANHNARPPGGVFIYKSDQGKLPHLPRWIPNIVKRNLPLLGFSFIKSVSWKTHSIKFPGRLAWGDIDGDGFPELAVSNANGSTMVFRNNKGNLEREPYWKSHDKEKSFDLLFADMDNDGLLRSNVSLTGLQIKNVVYLPHHPIHLITNISINSDNVSRKDYCYNLKEGWISFNKLILKSANNIKIRYVYSRDIDLVVAKSTWEGNPEDGKKDVIYLNNNGSLSRKANWKTRNKTLSTAVAVGDVDNDGDLDLVFGGEVGMRGKTKVPQHVYLYYNRTIN